MRLARRVGMRKAKVALARKLAVAALHVGDATNCWAQVLSAAVPVKNPQADRDNLLEAMRLLELAGYAGRDLRLVDVTTSLHVESPAPSEI